MTEEKKGIMDLSLKECEKLGIKMSHFKMEGLSFDMPWDIIIKTVNYLAKSEVLSWKTTFKETVELMGTFL